jgi:hypothetical protein
MWKRLSKREKRLAAVTLIILAAVVAYRAVFLPQLRGLWNLRDQAANLELEIIEMERALALGDRIERQYRDYEAIISQEGTDLEESTAFLRMLSDITKANDMKVVRQEQPPILPSRYYKIFSARLVVNTRHVKLASFLVSLEKGKELIRIEDILVKALDENENLSVGMKLTKVVAAEGKVTN